MKLHGFAVLACAVAALVSPVLADPPLPQGRGLAARYPGDRGVARDPAVIFADSFESNEVG